MTPTFTKFIEDNTTIVIIFSFLIGFILCYLFIKKNNKENRDTNNPEAEKLKLQIEKLEKEKSKLKNNINETNELLKKLDTNAEVTNNNSTVFLSEIKKLKEELEDIEDEKEDLEKKLKRLKNEKNEVEEQLNLTTSEKTQLHEKNHLLITETEQLNSELVVTQNKLDENINDLKFINGILDANNSTNIDAESIDHKTWNILSSYENNIEYWLDEESQQDYADKLWLWRNQEIKTWVKNKRIIAIVGEFSSGKTSIVNRILSQDDPNAILLPTSSKETTAIPTYISNGNDFNCQLFSPDHQLKNIKKETFEMVTKSVLDKVNISSLIQYFVLSYNNKYLDGLSILDTPGFGSNSDEIIKRTSEVVKEANALFWVIDANTGDINTTSVEVMKEHLKGIPLYFIINKSDTKSPDDLNKLEEKIKQTAINNNIEFKEIIFFSQKENVEVLMQHINQIQITPQNNLLKEIINKIDKKIAEFENDKRATQKKNHDNNLEIEKTLEGFNSIKNEINYHSNQIINLLQYKSPLFGANHYKVSENDYISFKYSLDTIEDNSNRIESHIDYYDQEIKEQISLEHQINNINNTIKYLKDSKLNFEKVVKAYNPSLLN
nr:dynamin family protein [uncultured Flavobacterium sp.]